MSISSKNDKKSLWTGRWSGGHLQSWIGLSVFRWQPAGFWILRLVHNYQLHLGPTMYGLGVHGLAVRPSEKLSLKQIWKTNQWAWSTKVNNHRSTLIAGFWFGLLLHWDWYQDLSIWLMLFWFDFKSTHINTIFSSSGKKKHETLKSTCGEPSLKDSKVVETKWVGVSKDR